MVFTLPRTVLVGYSDVSDLSGCANLTQKDIDLLMCNAVHAITLRQVGHEADLRTAQLPAGTALTRAAVLASFYLCTGCVQGQKIQVTQHAAGRVLALYPEWCDVCAAVLESRNVQNTPAERASLLIRAVNNMINTKKNKGSCFLAGKFGVRPDKVNLQKLERWEGVVVWSRSQIKTVSAKVRVADTTFPAVR